MYIKVNVSITNYIKISNKAHIPVTTTLHALGVFNEKSKYALKMLGMHGSVQANMAMQNADLILCIGSRFEIHFIK